MPLTDLQAIGASELRQHGLQRRAIHLAVDFLREVTRLGGERATTADPDRAADGAGARLAGALLAPRLDAAAAHFGFGLLRFGARTARRHVGDDDLVHQGFVVLAGERRVGDLDVLRLSTLADELEVHGPSISYFFAGAMRLRLQLRGCLHRRTHDHLTARCARNGAADQQQVALGIDAHDLQVLDGATDLAHVAGHALTEEHATRRLALTDRTGRAMRHGHAVRGRQTAEVVALHDAGVSPYRWWCQ